MEFKTIEREEQAELIEKKSKFIAQIIPITSVQDANEKLERIRKIHRDARHHCYAYRVWEKENVIERASDDGEPSGTAGSPILHILYQKQVCNILLVVTRYFGGILLGTGGLLKAYQGAAILALEKATFLLQEDGVEMEVWIPYECLEQFKYFCKHKGIRITQMEYIESIKCKIEIQKEELERILNNNWDTSFKVLKYTVKGSKMIQKMIK